MQIPSVCRQCDSFEHLQVEVQFRPYLPVTQGILQPIPVHPGSHSQIRPDKNRRVFKIIYVRVKR